MKKISITFSLVFLLCISFTLTVSAAPTSPSPLIYRADRPPVSIEEAKDPAYNIGDFLKDHNSAKTVHLNKIDGLLMINGTFMKDYFPVNENNTNLVPIRAITDNLGIKIDWNSTERKVTATKDGKKVEMTIDNKTAYIDGTPTTLLVAPKIIKTAISGTTYVPLRFVAEAFNLEVGFDKTVLGFPVVWVCENYGDELIKVAEDDALPLLLDALAKENEYYKKLMPEDLAIIFPKDNFFDTYKFKQEGSVFGRFYLISSTNVDYPKFPFGYYLIDKYTGDMFIKNNMGIYDSSYLFTLYITG